MNKLIRRFGLLIALTLAGGGAGAAYAAFKTPTYTAKAYVVAIAGKSDPMTALNFAQAYGRIATSGPVLAAARTRLTDASGLTSVRSSTSPDAPVVEITATGSAATHTTDLANAVAGALADYGSLRKADTDVTLSVLAPATVPVRPSSPKPPLELAVGAAGGLLAGALASMAGSGLSIGRRKEVEVSEAVGRASVSWAQQPPAITAYRSSGNSDEPFPVVTDLKPVQEPTVLVPVIPVSPADTSAAQRAVGRAVVAGMEDDE
ncbi:Wzz/FepE/Etk N-terminal domain-containing protein [Actinoplanes sp. TFC3]|uniref:Wzz/FepE/Etk N-terminal domain-containing protein n=1 Tax=Actinoplanes sp. TFC3 TaxID=1710355 RepID=UPI000834255D|nr:Wzz/FepE/Etk N-terminal domain-containing protein [Actinoplanes sp. TFC3]